MADQSNEELARKYVKKAKVALEHGNLQKAEKYLVSAESIYPSSRVKNLLERVRASERQQNPPDRSSTSSEIPVRSRKRPISNKPALPSSNSPKQNRSYADAVPKRETLEQSPKESPAAEYTEEQLFVVNRILKCKNIYEILDVSKNASKSDVEKAYRRLAVLVHPDKTHAPGAKEAFQMLGHAAEILRDDAKRAAYDLKEAADSEYEDYMRGFEADHSAEQVFCMFFGAVGLAAAGGYVGYKLGSALSRNKHSREVEWSEPRERECAVTAGEGLGAAVGLAVGGLASLALLNALTK